MQLAKKLGSKKPNREKVNVKLALTVAATALLGAPCFVNAAETSALNAWSFDTAVLYYAEVDRVTATEAMLGASKTFDDGSVLSLKFTLDVLTGTSPNGAVAQPTTQTFTRPSGNGEYQTPANKTPIYDGFRDRRVQFNGQWTQPLAANYTVSGGVHISKEYDYLSLGVNGSLAYEFNNKNSTFSIGSSYFKDTYNPVGGIPKPLTVMITGSGDEDVDDPTRLGKDDTKSSADIMFGVTQVINRRLIMAFNYSYAKVGGYLNDPYKRLSRVNANGEAVDYVYESRPDSREKQSVFTQAKYNLGGALLKNTMLNNTVLDISYRYMWDDWQINSHTIDSRFYIPIGINSYLEPHFRVYQQSAAKFYQPFLNEPDSLPTYASADLRIGEMTAYTLGLKYGTFVNGGDELSFRLEYYTQRLTNAGFNEPGILSRQALYESVNAIIAQVTYSF
ncbi:MAG: DUF3570 domain-containing protein [Colwellia sp.]|nr:DUF3570 domain-containing protein [Colwellia sp.]